MKKTPLLHGEISSVIAEMGHGDSLVIADSGLPIPMKVRRIDLALTKGIPRFIDTLDIILKELQIEEILLAEEILEVSHHLYDEIKRVLNHDVKVTFVKHEVLKQLTEEAKAVVRTGEFTPYANIILKSGVVF